MKSKKVVCPNCRHPGFWLVVYPPTVYKNRPHFRCDGCDSADWSCGLDGGEYIGAEMGIMEVDENGYQINAIKKISPNYSNHQRQLVDFFREQHKKLNQTNR